jgi:hypothetical protein
MAVACPSDAGAGLAAGATLRLDAPSDGRRPAWAANFLVIRPMDRSQQMRWSRRGADLLLQLRCAVYNGTLGNNFGQRFYAANDALPQVATAA